MRSAKLGLIPIKSRNGQFGHWFENRDQLKPHGSRSAPEPLVDAELEIMQ